MDSLPQVIDFKRRMRMYPVEKPWFQTDTNTVCIAALFVGFCMAWIRAVQIRSERTKDQF